MIAAQRKLVADDGAKLDARVAAVGLLAESTDRQDFDLLAGTLSPQQPVELQSAAIRAWAARPRRQPRSCCWPAGRPLAPGCARAGARHAANRAHLVGAAVGSASKTARSRPARSMQRPRQRLVGGSPEVRARAEKLLIGDSGARSTVVEEHQSVLALKGDTTHGREVYLKRCAACHVLEDKDTQLAPIWRGG